MKAVTIRDAKASLNALVEAAERGEQVVLMRGSKHVAVIVPISEEDLELSARLSDAQAERFWRELEEERSRGEVALYDSAEELVSSLRVREAPATPKSRSTSKKRKKTKKRG